MVIQESRVQGLKLPATNYGESSTVGEKVSVIDSLAQPAANSGKCARCFGSSEGKACQNFVSDIRAVENMFKSLIKSL